MATDNIHGASGFHSCLMNSKYFITLFRKKCYYGALLRKKRKTRERKREKERAEKWEKVFTGDLSGSNLQYP